MGPHALAAGPPPTPSSTMGKSIPQALLQVETMAVEQVVPVVAQVAASEEVVAVVAQVATSN